MMGLPLTIQEDDNKLILKLQKELHLKSKIEVVRKGLRLLEDLSKKESQKTQWEYACKAVVESSQKINKEFQKHSLLKKGS